MNLQSHRGWSQVKSCSWTWLKYYKEALEERTEDLCEKQVEEAAYRTQGGVLPTLQISGAVSVVLLWVEHCWDTQSWLNHAPLWAPASPPHACPFQQWFPWHCSSLGSPVVPGQWLQTWQHMTTVNHCGYSGTCKLINANLSHKLLLAASLLDLLGVYQVIIPVRGNKLHCSCKAFSSF